MPAQTDICVIGAGAGGLTVAAGAVQMGARVVLVEAAEMGGDCLNRGCVPSKALIAAAAAAAAQRQGFAGVKGHEPEVDFAAVNDHLHAVIARIAPADSQERFEALGCTVIRAKARFTAPDEVEAGGQKLRARRFVIATGSRPGVPPIPGVERVPFLTSDTLFTLRERPRHLVVVGAGPVGVEMAQAFRRLGTPVTLVEAARLLGGEDPELVAPVRAALRAEGVDLREGQGVARLAGGAGAVQVVLADGSALEGSHLLIATGRQAALDGLGLAAAGVAFDGQGVRVDARLRSVTNARVFAVGDAAGGPQLTHLAAHHAAVVIRQAVAGLPARVNLRSVPRAVYSDPELAQVGLTEAEARAAFGPARVRVIREEFARNDRAVAGGHAAGLIKIVVVGGRPVGAGIAGPQAAELIGFWALAIASRLRMTAIAGAILPYPTLSEVSKRATGACISPKLFDNPWLKQWVRLVQRVLP